MKKIVVCFSDELRCAAALVAHAEKLPGETVLWVLGGLDGFPAPDTGAKKDFKICSLLPLIYWTAGVKPCILKAACPLYANQIREKERIHDLQGNPHHARSLLLRCPRPPR